MELNLSRDLLIDKTTSEISVNYPDIINKILTEKGVMCTLVSYFKRTNKKVDSTIPKIAVYLKCMHVKCKDYKFCIMDTETDPLSIKLLSRGSFNEDIHKAVYVTRPLTKDTRERIGTDLKHLSPSVCRINAIQDVKNSPIAKKRLLFGDLGAIKSHDVYKKLKQEVNEANDYDKDDLIDLLMLQRHDANSQWFLSFSTPF